MILRRRFGKRVLLVVIVFILSFYFSALLFGDLKVPKVMHLTDLSHCPVCYGISVCPELYSNQVILDSSYSWSNIFNAKNIYQGFTTKNNRKIVLKKLAHNTELRLFDKELCETWGLKPHCKPIDILNLTNIENKVIKEVSFDLTSPDIQPRKGLVFCPYADGFYDFVQPVLDMKKTNTKSYKAELINVWTMLAVNPEPIIIQVIPKSKGWPVPAYGGVCGRLELVANEGVPLSDLFIIEWVKKLQIAKNILTAAMDFTFKHDRFRFYLMDWSQDNIVINEKNQVAFVDLEDVIVLDKHISPGKDLPEWYKRYSRDDPDPRYTFSIDSICKHHLSDHNLWAACYVLAGDEDPLLYPMEPYDTKLDRYLQSCLKGYDDRFSTVRQLQRYIDNMLDGRRGYAVLNDKVR